MLRLVGCNAAVHQLRALVHEPFRLGSGYEHRAVDAEAVAAEVGISEHVLQRFALLDASDGCVEAQRVVGRQLLGGTADDVSVRQTEQLFDKDACYGTCLAVVVRGGYTMPYF